jgi:hypothetical protein
MKSFLEEKMDKSQPYDITSIPYYPYEPSSLEWIVLGAFVIGILSFSYIRKKLSPVFNSKQKILNKSLSELEIIWQSTDTQKSKSTPTANLLRKLLGLSGINIPFACLTSGELKKLDITTNPSITNYDLNAISYLTATICELDEIRFKEEFSGSIDYFSQDRLIDIKTHLGMLFTSIETKK